ISQAYASGKTVILHNAQQRLHELAALCRSLENSLRCPVIANLYFTPRHSQGFGAHFDNQDVLVMQLEGKKHWRVSSSGPRLPLSDYPLVEYPKGSVDMPFREFTLEAGDLLYVPRGHFHEAASSDVSSLHLSVTLMPLRWVDLVADALKKVARQDVRFRRA